MLELVALKPNACSYLIDDGNKNKKGKRHKKCVIKQNLKFKNYKKWLKAYHLENEINLLEKK